MGFRRWPRSRQITAASFAAAVILFAVLVYLRRWICDDALIIIRVVNELADGYGPNFNFFERAEPTTSTVWFWLSAIGGLITRDGLPWLMVLFGGLFSVAGLAIALDASRRLHRARMADVPMVPCGALVVLAVFVFRDFATSGLETGLAFAWVSASFWVLVTMVREHTRRRQLASALLIGLGPLVRPDLALAALPMLGVLVWLARPTRRRAVALVAAGLALPLAYTIIRAGYYGILVPLPALAKSAGDAQWSRGLHFLGRFIWIPHLWLPLAVLLVLAAVAVKRGMLSTRERILVATPVGCGLLLAVYVTRVGGDFMFGRMLLIPTWLVVLPAMALPLRRAALAVLLPIAVWALFTGVTLRRLDSSKRGWYEDWDEHEAYIEFTKDANGIDPVLFVQGTPAPVVMGEARRKGSPPLLVWDANGHYTLLDPAIDAQFALVAGRLGTAGVTVESDDIVVDMLGLANPLGARITPTFPGRTGHEKLLPAPWVLAEYAHPDVIASLPDNERAPVEAAKRALQCGDLAELIASVREPMSASRFWKNLTGAWRRTRLVVPNDPIKAEFKFCSR